MIKAIVAVDNKWGIGKQNKLLVNIPEDMKHFRELTENSTVIMGMNTFKSMNYSPLQGRQNIVVSVNTKNPYSYNNLFFMKPFEIECFLQRNPNNNIFIIGGRAVYNFLLKYVEKIYVTKLYGDFNADLFFPCNLDECCDFCCSYESDTMTNKDSIDFKFCVYERMTKNK